MNWGLGTDANDAADQLVAFRDAGGTLVDTADVYQNGHSEHILGGLLGTVVPRDDIIVATKAGAHRHDGPFGTGASRGALLNALDGSLRRLRVDHIDLWQLHTWDPSVPLQETLDALDTAVNSGKVRYVGVSNHTGWQLATTATLSRTTRTALSSLQTEYSLVERTAEHEIVPAADHHGLGLLAWAPLGRGVLTGKYRTTTPADSRGAHPHLADYVDHHRTERASRIVQAVFTAAEGLGTSPMAVALAWVRDRPGVASAVLGARTSTQLTTSLASEDIVLPPTIQAALDDVSATTDTGPAPG